RAAAGALQRRQHLDDFGAARIQRASDLLLMFIERAQSRFRICDAAFDVAHAGGNVDELLIELASVLADRGDIGLELRLLVGAALLLLPSSLELLLALLQRVGRGRRGLRRRLRG